MSKTTKAPAKSKSAPKQKGKESKLPAMPAKYLQDVSKSAKDQSAAQVNAQARWDEACKAVNAILTLKVNSPDWGESSALATGRGRDGWGSTDTTRCRFIHEALFAQCFDYESGKLLPAPVKTLNAGEIHAFTCAAQVMTGVEQPDTITTLSATQSHLSSLCSKYFDGSLQQGCERGSDKASIRSAGNGYAMNAHFARDYFKAKQLRGEVKGATKGKGSK